MIAYAATSGISRYHKEFPSRVAARNTIPPHRAMKARAGILNIMTDRGLLKPRGSPTLQSTWSMNGLMVGQKNNGVIAANASAGMPAFMVMLFQNAYGPGLQTDECSNNHRFSNTFFL